MFGFSKKEPKIPGWDKDQKGNWVFTITEEEQVYVKSAFSQFEGFVAEKEVAEVLQNELRSSGLSNYAANLVLFNEDKKESKERTQNLEKALSALYKALSFSQSPMAYFTIAQIYEALNKKNLAKQTYKDFLDKCEEPERKNAPDIIRIFLKHVHANIPDCIQIAEQKVKELA